MDENNQDLVMAEANALLPAMLEMAKGNRASAFSIAALAVIRAYVEKNPDLGPWMGTLLANEGMTLLAASQQQAQCHGTAMAMPTSSVH